MTQQEFTNKYFYQLFLFTLLFGIVFYDIIGFKAADELCGLLLLLLFGKSIIQSKDWQINKFFLVVIGIFVFYTAYSLYIGSNSMKAILMDLIIQMKPYLAFFCTYQLMPTFDKSQKKILKDLSILLWFYLSPLEYLDS